jgi:subtilisin family serine protease
MHKSWRFIPSLAAAFGVIAVLALGSGAWAQDQAGTGPGAAKRYVLMSASGTWGAAQTATINRLGATVGFSHAASGLGSAVSTDPDFLKAAMKSGAFSKGSLDMQVQWVDPNEKVSAESVEEDVVTPGNETFVNEQWNIVAVNAAGAWGAGYTGAGVRVAVIDGGLYNTHVDLVGRVDVARSASFVPGFAFNQDVGTFWHATHVAGIIAASDNGIGTIGIAPDATIIGCKALHNGSGSFEAVIAAILYASDPISAGGAGADIINMSLGALFPRGGGNTGAGALVAAMNQAVNYATAHNVLVVSAAGNAGVDLDHSGSLIQVPAQSGSGIAISATGPLGYGFNWPNGATNYGHPAYYTNFGQSAIWLAAPGGEDSYPSNAICAIPRCCGGPAVAVPCWVHDLVMSTVRGSGASTTTYGWADGTSMAAPAVSAVAAIIKQRFPSFGANDLKTFLAQSADGVNGNDALRPYYGHGFVDAGNAATAATTVPEAKANLDRKMGPAVAAATRPQLLVTGNGGAHPELSFTLPSAGPARVELFDVAGRKVATLYDGAAASGRTTLSWSVGSLHAGAYFARMTANGVSQSRQVILLGQ